MYSSNDINKIKNSDSRKNFNLVLQSFYSKNYKSSILLLYNLVVNDLYSKLMLMDEKNYINCKSELEYIENILRDNDESKFSVVEEKIFDTYKQKKILNHSTLDLLNYFKKIRNKCAHPIFFKEIDYTPTEDEVYLFINKIYKDILIVEAYFKEPYGIMKNDIENYQFPKLDELMLGIGSITSDTEKVKKYFENKYYKYMTEKNYIKLFKNLVDLSISKNNEEILKNQYNHFLLLNALLKYLSYIGKLSILNQQYDWQKIDAKKIYDDIDKKFGEQECFSLSYLFSILKYNHNFVEEMKDENEEVYELLKEKLYSNSYLFVEFWMVFDSDINSAAKKISDSILAENYMQIIESIYTLIDKKVTIELIEKMLNKIPNFDGYDIAGRCIDVFIKILNNSSEKIKQEDIEKCFSTMDSNRQIYDRRRNNRNSQIRQIINLGYDLSEYENLQVEGSD